MLRIPSLICVVLALASLLFLHSTTNGQNEAASTHVYLPVMRPTGASNLGMAFTNPSLVPAEIKLIAHAYTGEAISGPEITNPATITLAPQGQRALQLTDIFGRGISGRAGWVDIVPSTSGVRGFFTFFDDGVTAIDGAPFADTPASTLVFPRITPETELAFVNTGSEPISNAALLLFDNDGRIVQRKLFAIGSYSGFAGRLSDLIPDAGSFSGYAELMTAGTPFSAALEVLVGFETYKNRADIAGLPALLSTGVQRDGYFPHFVSQGGYYSRLGLINPTSQSQRVIITTDAPGSNNSVERVIPPAARLDEKVDQLFGFSGDATIAGEIHYQVQDDGNGLIGFVEYGTNDGLLLSAGLAQGTQLSDIFFSQIAESGGFYTGLALLNPNSISASVTVDAFDEKGRRLASTALRLDAGERRTRLLKEFLPAIGNQSGGYIHLSAPRGIFATELFGTSSGNVLANVPAQGVQLPTQGSGRPVSVSQGANVVANDGQVSVAIPPGALDKDAIVRVSAVPVTDLPNPAADQRVAGAVTAEPSGISFKIPVKLTFPLAAQLPKDSSLSLLLFNPGTQRYDPTEFTATVDESGRTATADVTHFSTFVVSIRNADLLTVSGITPSSGKAGTGVTITGDGFSPNALGNAVNFAGPDNSSRSAPVTTASANSLSVTVPVGAVTGYVTVRSGTRSSLGVVFTVPEDQPKPFISSVFPATVLVGEPTRDLEIRGTGFRSGSKVTYDDANIVSTYVDATLLMIAPENDQLKGGVHRIAVTNAPPGGGTSKAVEFTVSYPAPKLSSLLPIAFDEGDGGDVSFTGTGFTRETTVLVDDLAMKPTFVGPNTLSLSRVSFQSGPHNIAVSNPAPGGGTSSALTLTVRPRARVAAILLTDPVSGRAVNELVVNEGNTIQPGVVIIDSSGSTNQTFGASFTSLDTAVATVDTAGNIKGTRAGFSTLIVNAGGAVAAFTVTVVGVDSGPGGFTVTGVAQDFARHVYLTATQEQTVLLLDDLKKDPTVYAGVRQTPGLKNDLRLQSWFKSPAFVTLNQAEGSLYVADAANNVIRRVSAGNSGKVETLAGTGTPGKLDGPAANATFNNPQGVVLDGSGHLWIADSGNHTIRRIDLSTKTVQTIAGQPGIAGFHDGHGSAATFRSPMGLAIQIETASQELARERAGLPPPPVSVIVADSGNGAIRRVSENGDVETLQVFSAGLTQLDKQNRQSLLATTFNSPTGVAVDPLGNIYVTESDSGTVKTILTNGDVVSAVQPNTFVNPKGLAITETGKVVVAGSNRIAQELRYGAPDIISITPERVPNTGGTTVTVRGSNFAPGSVLLVGGVIIPQAVVQNTQRIIFTTPALPSGITTVTVQNRGGIAQRSWVIDPIPLALLPAGQITTVAGGATFIGDGANTGSASLLPWKPVVDAFGDVYAVDYLHNRIRKINSTTGIIITVAGTGESGSSGDGGLATAATFNAPQGMAIDADGNLLIADTGNSRIRKVDISSGIVTTIAGDGVSRFTGDGGPAVSASLSIPGDIAIDTAGNLIIADTGNNRIRKIGVNGTITTIAGTGQAETGVPADNVIATIARLNFPEAVAVDSNGTVIVADTFTHTVRKIGTDGKIHTIAGNGSAGDAANQLNAPEGLALDASGNLFIADSGNDRIQKLDAASNTISTAAGTGETGFFGDNGAANLAKFNFPLGLAVNGAGDLLIADALNLRVRQVAATSNIIQTIAGNGELGYLGDSQPATAAGLNYPQGIAFDGNGNLYVADTHRIRRISASTGIITTVAGNGQAGYSPDGTSATKTFLNGPTGIVIDAAGNIFFTETGNNMIREISASTNTIVTIAGTGAPLFSGDNGQATSAALSGPTMLAWDNNRSNLYVSDTNNQRIRKINLATGVITTVAGNGAADFSGNGGPATSAALNYPFGIALDSTNNLLIADRLNGMIRKVSAATGVITAFAGIHSFGFGGDGGPAAQALLNYPLGIALDSQGNVFFADAGNARVRKVAAGTNIITTVAGNGASGLAVDNVPAPNTPLGFPLALQFDANGNLFFTDPSIAAARIRAIRAPIP